MAPSLAIIGSLSLGEVMMVVVVALLVFGGRLPEVALRAAAQVMRARKVVTKMWREAGLEQELRRVQWDIESRMPRDADFDLKADLERSPKKTTHHPEEGTEHLEGSAEQDLDPAIGYGAPSGTVASGSDGDPPPPPPDVPPRDEEPASSEAGDDRREGDTPEEATR